MEAEVTYKTKTFTSKFKLLFIALVTPLILATLFTLVAPNEVSAATNSTLEFKGKIINKTTGTNLAVGTPACIVAGAANDTCDFRVSIYSDASGGTLLWAETHPNIEISNNNGSFSLSLNSVCNNWASCGGGSGLTWGADASIYTQIEFDPSGNADFAEGETFSRRLISNVPYAYEAGTLGGIAASGFVQVSPAAAQSTSVFKGIYINENGTYTGDLIDLRVGGARRFTVTNGGQLVINGTPDATTAFLELPASTGTIAHMNFSTGTAPTTPFDGQLWWNSSQLLFYNGSTATDLLLTTSLFSFNGISNSYRTNTASDLSIGGDTILNSAFVVDVSENRVTLGDGLTVSDAIIDMYASNAATGQIRFTANDRFTFTGGNVFVGNSTEALTLFTPNGNDLSITGDLAVNGNLIVQGNIIPEIDQTEVPTLVFTSVKTKPVNHGTTTQWDTTSNIDYVASTNNFYTAGQFSGTTNFGGVQMVSESPGHSAWYIGKYDSNFNVVWVQKIDGTQEAPPFGPENDDIGSGVAVDSANSVYTHGFTHAQFEYYVNPNPAGTAGTAVAPGGGYNAYIFKYNSAGTYQWHRGLTGAGVEGGQGIAIDSGDNIYAVGLHDNTTVVQGCANLATAGGNDWYLVKYNSAGTCQWRVGHGGAGSDIAWEVATFGTSIYVVGEVNGVATLRKYNDAGTFQWEATVNGTGADTANGIAADSFGNVFWSGTTGTGTVTFTNAGGGTAATIGSVPANTRFVTKYNSSGTMLWQNTYVEADVSNLAVDKNNHVLLTGFVAGGNANHYIRKYYDDGQFAYMTSTGDAGLQDHTMAVTSDNLGRPVTAGYANGGATFRFLAFYKYESAFTAPTIGSASSAFANAYAGTYRGRELLIAAFDLAEEYEVEDASIGPGDVVRFKNDSSNLVIERAGGEGKPYDDEAMGVISTEPGLYLKDWEANKENGRPVALAGRVPVKVNLENGPIKRGDYLTASSTPGYAMKATKGGVIIGRAMEDFSGGGDSQLVEEQLAAAEAESVAIVTELQEEGKITETMAADATELVAEVTEVLPTTTSEGRILMYVDKGYVGDSIYEARAQLENAVNIDEFEVSNANKLFDIVEGSGTTKLVTSGKIETSALNTNVIRTKDINDIVIRLASGKGLRVVDSADSLVFGISDKGKLSLKEGEGSSLGVAEILAGEKEVFVTHASITSSSKVIATAKDAYAVGYQIEPDNGGFRLKIKDLATENVIINYLILN